MSFRAIPKQVLERIQVQTGARKRPCAHCPSANFPPDPEAADILAWPKEERAKTAFCCAWTPGKLCRGYLDQMGITEGEAMKDTAQRGEASDGER